MFKIYELRKILLRPLSFFLKPQIFHLQKEDGEQNIVFSDLFKVHLNIKMNVT
ncbi:MAG: hypothetical protein QXT67_01570 [Candidatus Bathyarchaeia archaeon]